jgi:hypothetical protein
MPRIRHISSRNGIATVIGLNSYEQPYRRGFYHGRLVVLGLGTGTRVRLESLLSGLGLRFGLAT